MQSNEYSIIWEFHDFPLRFTIFKKIQVNASNDPKINIVKNKQNTSARQTPNLCKGLWTQEEIDCH